MDTITINLTRNEVEFLFVAAASAARAIEIEASKVEIVKTTGTTKRIAQKLWTAMNATPSAESQLEETEG